MSDTSDWEQLILLGHLQFNQGSFEPAAHTYDRARSLLLQRATPWQDAADAVTAMAVTYLNLAEAQGRCQAVDAACKTLCTLHEALLQARDNPALDDGHREAALAHLRESFAALLRFRDRHGDRPELHRLLCPDCAQRLPASARPGTLH